MTKAEKLLEKRKNLQAQIKDHKLKSVEGFKWSDVFLGAFIGFILMGVFMWIPVIGWMAMPFCVPIGACMGTHIRQNMNSTNADNLQKEIEKIDRVLEILGEA